MTLEQSLLSLQGLSLGDAFGASLFFPQALILIETRVLPEAPWCWTDDTQIALAVLDELRERGMIDQDSLARRLARAYSVDSSRGYAQAMSQVLERITSGEYFRSAARSTLGDGAYSSAAPARAAPIGAYFAGAPDRAAREALLAAGVTHTYPESLAGAEAVAAAASIAAAGSPPAGEDFLRAVLPYVQESDVREALEIAAAIPAHDFFRAVEELGVGLSNSAQDTVPFSLWCAAHHLDDFEEALWQAVAGMGLRDTVCAIVGGITALSALGLPEGWLARREPLPGERPPRSRTLQILSPGGPALFPGAGLVSRNLSAPDQSGIREDALTGLPNLLSLLDWVKNRPETGDQKLFSLLSVRLPSLRQVNRRMGRTAGDELLKNCAHLLESSGGGPVFRTGGDQFALILSAGDPARAAAQALNLADRLDQEYGETNLEPARLALVHFLETEKISPGFVLSGLFLALDGHQFSLGMGRVREFNAGEMRSRPDYPWMIEDLAEQMLRLGCTADELLNLARTDSVSQLPNMRAAMSAFETAVAQAWRTAEPLTVLLVDGDNLRQYNQISYEAGDEAILLLGVTLQLQLRQSDFLARWRTGDEFLVLLPNTGLERALHIGQRLCAAVERASRTWLLPSTISVGAAAFPEHGQSVQELLHVAERGLEAAKDQGKNRVAVCGPD